MPISEKLLWQQLELRDGRQAIDHGHRLNSSHLY